MSMMIRWKIRREINGNVRKKTKLIIWRESTEMHHQKKDEDTLLYFLFSILKEKKIVCMFNNIHTYERKNESRSNQIILANLLLWKDLIVFPPHLYLIDRRIRKKNLMLGLNAKDFFPHQSHLSCYWMNRATSVNCERYIHVCSHSHIQVARWIEECNTYNCSLVTYIYILISMFAYT
jgi:hypothetical protein